MKLNSIQLKYINSKPVKHSILKGKSNLGKTETLLYRLLKIKNNYAFQEEDKILFVQKERTALIESKAKYEKIKEKNDGDYLSLLPCSEEMSFISLDELLNKYLSNKSLASKIEKQEALRDVFSRNSFKGKKLTLENKFNIFNEIRFMKNKEVKTLEEYNQVIGAPLKIRRNTNQREEMFNLFKDYNNILHKKGLIDEEDRVLLALSKVKDQEEFFIHLLIDNGEGLSSLELKFLMSLYKDKPYGSITLAINIDKGENIFSNLVKKGRVYGKKVFGNNKKIYTFKEIEEVKNIQVEEENKFTFINLKHKTSLELNNIYEDVIGEERESIPVFNNIAAGEPILIAPEQEDNFYLPKEIVRGANKKFILKVKGDSMINVNINDGDYVVIEQNHAPVNGDIVAVNLEGNATLKTLCLTRTTITLKAENIKYDPIEVTEDKEFYILGKAIGILKS